MRQRQRSRRVLLALVVPGTMALVAAACSSTTSASRSGPASSSTPGAPAKTTEASDQVAPSTTVGPARPAGTARVEGDGTTRAASGSQASPPRRGAPEVRAGPPPTAPAGKVLGAADTTIKVGVLAWKPDDVSALGFTYSRPDVEPVIQAQVDEINARGGIAGRRVEAVVAKPGLGNFSTSAWIAEQNRACASLTEDHHVFVVLSLNPHGYFARECYASHRTPYLEVTTLADEKDVSALAPWILPPVQPNITTVARFLPPALRDQGFMEGRHRMGVFVIDFPQYRRTARDVLVPRLRAAGGELADEHVVHLSAENIESFAASVATSMLRFKREGIDRVVIWDGGETWALLARQAEVADYHPRYGIHSQLAPEHFKDHVPPRHRQATVGAGWSPSGDVAEEVLPPTQRERECWAAVNRRAGTSYHARPKGTDRQDGSIPALRACQLFEMAQAALAPARGRALAQGELLGFFQALGHQPPAVTPPDTFFGEGKWDGSRYYAHFAYDAHLGFFRYTSGWLEIQP